MPEAIGVDQLFFVAFFARAAPEELPASSAS